MNKDREVLTNELARAARCLERAEAELKDAGGPLKDAPGNVTTAICGIRNAIGKAYAVLDGLVETAPPIAPGEDDL